MEGVFLIFFACSTSTPVTCTEQRLSYKATETTLQACYQYNLAWLAAWQDKHPGWRIDWSRKRRCTTRWEQSV
jgi:hypothetical protein